MRLWSLHPQYLDRQGLTALWREALLAKAVMNGQTRGYRHHPQLQRFQAHPEPLLAINVYLHGIHEESLRRGYRFDASKVGQIGDVDPIAVASGQLEFEWQHLLGKLAARSPEVLARWQGLSGLPNVHPMLTAVNGGIADWERP